MKMIDWNCFFLGRGGVEYYKMVVLQVIAEKMKLCFYLHVGKILSHRIFPSGWTLKCVYSICHQVLFELTKEGRKVKGWDMYNVCEMRHGYRVTRNP
jgi:hypothetical protein